MYSVVDSIGALINPKGQQIDVRRIHKLLGYDYGREKKKGKHGTKGKLVLRRRKDNYPELPKDGESDYKVSVRIGSPESDRRAKVARRGATRSECTEMAIEDVDEKVGEFPPWSRFIPNLEERCPALLLCENEDIGFDLMRELEVLWKEWSVESVRRIAAGDVQQPIAFDKRPFWRPLSSASESAELSGHIHLHFNIVTDFWTNVAPNTFFRWDLFFGEEAEPLGQSLSAFAECMDTFLKSARRILRFHWPLGICELLLENSDSWMKLILEPERCDKFFDAIASLQTHLLVKVLKWNSQLISERLLKNSRTSPALRIFVNDDEDLQAVNGQVERLRELVECVPRVETKLSPKLYPQERYLDIGDLYKADLSLQAENPFDVLQKQLSEGEQKVLGLFGSAIDIAEWKRLVEDIESLKGKIEMTKTKAAFGRVLFDFVFVKRDLLARVDELQKKLKTELLERQLEENVTLLTDFSETCAKLYGKNQFEQMAKIAEVRDVNGSRIFERCRRIVATYLAVLDLFGLPEVELARCYEISRIPRKLETFIDTIWEQLQADRYVLERAVNEKAHAILFEVEMLERDFQAGVKKYRVAALDADVRRVAQRFEELATRLQIPSANFPEVSSQLALLDMEPLQVDLAALGRSIDLFREFTSIHVEVIKCHERWMDVRVSEVDCAEFVRLVEALLRRLEEIEKRKEAEEDEYLFNVLNMVVTKIREVVDKFRVIVPVLMALNAAKAQLWNIILEKLEETRVPEEFRVRDLLAEDVLAKIEKYEDIAATIGKEIVAEEEIERLRAEWTEVNLAWYSYRNQMINMIAIRPDLHALLAKQINRCETLLAPEQQLLVSEYLSMLSQFGEFVDLYDTVERTWSYLEPVLSLEDMAYQMPEEWKIFQEITASWRNTNEQLITISGAFETLLVGVGHMAELRRVVSQFNSIQGGFDAYLQKRKQVFPRLYFLSNAEVLDLLSESQNPAALRGYFSKLFRGIGNIHFNAKEDAVAVESPRGARLDLRHPVNVTVAKRYVEKWLIDMEREIAWTVKKTIKELHKEAISPLKRLYEFAPEYPLSLLVVFARIAFTAVVERGLAEKALEESKKFLEAVLDNCRNEDRFRQLRIECSYYLSRAHALIENESTSPTDPIWYSALRYYWHNDNVFLRVFSLSFTYDYEYGIHSKTRLEPADRYFETQRSLLLSERLRHGCLIPHDRATVIQEYAYRTGRSVVFFNCSPSTCRETLGSLLTGAVQTGTLLFLEAIDYLSSDSLHFILAHIATILQMVEKGVSYYRIQQLEVSISPSFSVVCSSSRTATLPRLAEAGLVHLDVPEEGLFQMFDVPSHLKRLLGGFLYHFEHLFAVKADSALVAKEANRLQRSNGALEPLVVFKTATKNVLGPMVRIEDRALFDALVARTFFTKMEASDPQTEKLKEDIEDGIDDTLKEKVARVLNLIRTEKKIALLGPPGSGKSTVLGIVARMMKQATVTTLYVNQNELDSGFSVDRWSLLDGSYNKHYVEFIDGLCENGQNFKANLEMVVLEEEMRFLYETDEPIPQWPTVRFDYPRRGNPEVELGKPISNLARLREAALSRIWKHRDYVNYLVFQGIPQEPEAKKFVEKLLGTQPNLLRRIPSAEGALRDLLPTENFFVKAVEALAESRLVFLFCGTSERDVRGCTESVTDRYHKLGSKVEIIRLGASVALADLKKELEDCFLLKGKRHLVVFQNFRHVRGNKALLDYFRCIQRDFPDTTFLAEYMVETVESSLDLPARLLRHLLPLYPPSTSSSGTPPVETLVTDDQKQKLRDVLAAEEIAGSSRRAQYIRRIRCLQVGGHSLLLGELGCGRKQLVAVAAKCVEARMEDLVGVPDVGASLQRVIRNIMNEGGKTIVFLSLREVLGFPDFQMVLETRSLPCTLLNGRTYKELLEANMKSHDRVWERFRENFHLVIKVDRVEEKNVPPWLRAHVGVVEFAPMRREDAKEVGVDYLRKTGVFDDREVELCIGKLVDLHFQGVRKGICANERQKFLDFLVTFAYLAARKRNSLNVLDKRYKSGVERLTKADAQMTFLQGELARLKPELVQTSLETTILMSTIEKETMELENVKEVVAANEHKANEAATKAQALKVECEREVAEAIPALEAAIEALNVMNPSDISSLKTMRFPPRGVRLVVEAVCILLGERPVRGYDENGKAFLDYWPKGQKMLSDIHFMSRIRTFPRDSIPTHTMRTIRRNYLSRPEFDADNMKAVSLAAEGLCLWIRALDVYNTISKVVEPKKERLRRAELQVKQHLKLLDNRRKALQEVTERLQKLSDSFSQMSQRKQDLSTQILNCQVKMGRAEKLVGALGGERERWNGRIEELGEEYLVHTENTLTAAFLIEYLQRSGRRIEEFGISTHFDILDIVEHTFALPSKSCLMVAENAAILEYSRKIPFVGDPYDLLPLYLPDKNVVSLDSKDPRLVDKTLTSLYKGNIVVVDEITDDVHVRFRQRHEAMGKILLVNGTEHKIPSTASLILRTRLPRFKVDGSYCAVHLDLDEQMFKDHLAELILCENHENLVTQKNLLSSTIDQMKKELAVMEEEILDVVASSNDLDNDRAVDLLARSRELSSSVALKTSQLGDIDEEMAVLVEKQREVVAEGARVILLTFWMYSVARPRFHVSTLFRTLQKSVSGLSKERSMENTVAKIKTAFQFAYSDAFSPEYRCLYHYVLEHCSSVPKISKSEFFEELQKNRFSSESSLKQAFRCTDPRVPIGLLVDSESDYVLRNLHEFAISPGGGDTPGKLRLVPVSRTTSASSMRRLSRVELRQDLIHHVVFEEFQRLLREDNWMQNRWIVVKNVPWNCAPAYHMAVAKMISADQLPPNFRLVFVLYPDDKVPTVVVEKSKLIDGSVVESLKEFLLRCYTSTEIGRVHDYLERIKNREHLFKLCCFHHIVSQRLRYGAYGWAHAYSIRRVHFHSAVMLFKDLVQSEAELNFHVILHSILLPSYGFQLSSDEHDLAVFSILAQWVFIGISKFDDRLLESVWLRSFHESRAAIVRVLGSLEIDESSVLGLSASVVRNGLKKRVLEMLNPRLSPRVVPLEEPPLLEYSAAFETFCLERCLERELRGCSDPHKKAYLSQLLRSSDTVVSIDFSALRYPEALLETLKRVFCEESGLPLSEVVLFASLDRSVFQKKPAGLLEATGFRLLGASFDFRDNCLEESVGRVPVESSRSVWIQPQRTVGAESLGFTIPVYHPNSKKSPLICVNVDSNIPNKHWLLRGVKIVAST
ncbi:hypothetical protein QR680_013403 [Steinernema hermaphroditum]|uniref:AAA+ ATPase domain-containing protein n=1 Tax=Steinernema hermaphroditum TaxID=289476 RepID=A0AA39I6R7_9BILA|nr:hypothetical protein QR680_013403 [Steinernema hermaphroditum]